MFELISPCQTCHTMSLIYMTFLIACHITAETEMCEKGSKTFCFCDISLFHQCH